MGKKRGRRNVKEKERWMENLKRRDKENVKEKGRCIEKNEETTYKRTIGREKEIERLRGNGGKEKKIKREL